MIQILINIAVAALCGALIGTERQLTGHVAGVQTNTLMCIGTCIFMQVPYMINSTDVVRMGAAVMQGVGFLCASVIFKESGVVKGVNTSVALLCSAGVGIISATGNIEYAIMITFSVIILNLIAKFLSIVVKPDSRISFHDTYYLLEIVCSNSSFKEIGNELQNLEKGNAISIISTETFHLENGDVQMNTKFKTYGKKANIFMREKVSYFYKKDNIKSISYKVL